MILKFEILIFYFCIIIKLSASTDDDIKFLIAQMDVYDKCGQMTQVTFEVIENENAILNQDPVDLDKLRTAIVEKRIGSILSPPLGLAQKASIWQTVIKHIHDETRNTKLKIPIIYGTDSIHGVNFLQEGILFPQPLAQAATFNVEIARKIGEIVAKESRSMGVPWNFSPVMDVGRQVLWPRLWETFGEDVRLAEQLGKAYIQGHQGDDLKNRTKSAVCLKHYIGYSNPYNGRDRSVAWIPENLLREYYLPPFESALIAGATTVMLNSGDVNGLPGHANYHYITEILKQELKFDGFTVSDWEDINRLYARDRVASSPEEAVRMSIMAGVDMSMVPYNYSFLDHCINLYNKDRLFEDRVNDAVLRILRVKKQIGLLVHSESIYPKEEDLANIGTSESDNIALDAARESIILAKNENNILPLSKSKNILVTGPSAHLLKVLNGGWSYKWQGDVESYFQTFSGRKYKTIYEAISLKSTGNVSFKQGANFTELTQDFNDIINSVQSADVIILCIGEDTYTETPGNIDNLMLSDPQMQLATKLLDTGKPVVVVFIGGRPRTITSIVKRANAVLFGFLPGNRGGDAIADIIFGDYNPNGKLPITYPKGPNGAMNYDYKPLEGYEVNNGENVASYFDAIFPFGFGLSYTQFEYSNLLINQKKISEPSSAIGSITVKNIGNLAGKETVIIYLNDEVGSLSRPVKQMKFFKKINLNPGASETVNFEITRNDMSFINLKNQRIVESGNFNIYVGNLTVSFELTAIPQDQNNSGNNVSIQKEFFTYIIALIIGIFHLESNQYRLM